MGVVAYRGGWAADWRDGAGVRHRLKYATREDAVAAFAKAKEGAVIEKHGRIIGGKKTTAPTLFASVFREKDGMWWIRYRRGHETVVESSFSHSRAAARKLLHERVGFDHQQAESRSRGRTGAAGELIVSADLILRGCDVLRNVSPNGPDLVAVINDRMCIVEVKVAASRILSDGRLVHHPPRNTGHHILAVVHLPTFQVSYAPDPFRGRAAV